MHWWPQKAQAALGKGVTPIVCVGETLAERDAGQTEAVVKRQLSAVIHQLAHCAGEMVVAYEPVWAIGTGRTATPEQAQAVHAVLRAQLQAATGRGDSMKILYGGSVKADNAATLFAQPDIDGGLIGGASLKASRLHRHLSRVELNEIPGAFFIMQIWMTLILAVQLLSALTMIGLVLIQHGKGADMGASFGSGASGSLFGATGSANFLSRRRRPAPRLLLCTLALAFMGNHQHARQLSGGSVLDSAPQPRPAFRRWARSRAVRPCGHRRAVPSPRPARRPGAASRSSGWCPAKARAPFSG
jgi:protein translocase SecG subunit